MTAEFSFQTDRSWDAAVAGAGQQEYRRCNGPFNVSAAFAPALLFRIASRFGGERPLISNQSQNGRFSSLVKTW